MHLSFRVPLLEALCGRRNAPTWIRTTVPEKRDLAQADSGAASERLPNLRVRPSSDGPKAITRIYQGFALPALLPPLQG